MKFRFLLSVYLLSVYQLTDNGYTDNRYADNGQHTQNNYLRTFHEEGNKVFLWTGLR